MPPSHPGLPPMSPPTVLNPPPPQKDFTIGWICVLPKEYFAAMTVLDKEYDMTDLVPGQGDVNGYSLGLIGEHNVVINIPEADTCGEIHAAKIATDMKSTFSRIRFVLLVGIGGGVPLKHDIRLGDVVLGTRVIPYAFGKENDFGFKRTGMVTSPPPELLTAITRLAYRLERQGLNLSNSIERFGIKESNVQNAIPRPSEDRLYMNDYIHKPGCDCLKPQAGLRSRMVQREPREGDLVRMHHGGIGAANKVIKRALLRDRIATKEDILCFEMEATGVMEALRCLPIRGISDYADGHKNDDWHSYAALAAAVCARELLRSISAQSVSQRPLELVGDELLRHIQGGVENANSGQSCHGDVFRSAQRALNILMERHDLVQYLLAPELQKLDDTSRSDIQEVRKKVKILEALQEELKKSLQVLQENVENQSKIHESQDFVTRKEWEELKEQVRENTQKVERWSTATQGALETASNLLGDLGQSINIKELSFAGRIVAYGAQFVGHVANLLSGRKKRVGSSTAEDNPISEDALPPSTSSQPGENANRKSRWKKVNPKGTGSSKAGQDRAHSPQGASIKLTPSTLTSPRPPLQGQSFSSSCNLRISGRSTLQIGQHPGQSDETIRAASKPSYPQASHQHQKSVNSTSSHGIQSPDSSNGVRLPPKLLPRPPPSPKPAVVRGQKTSAVPNSYGSLPIRQDGTGSSQASNVSSDRTTLFSESVQTPAVSESDQASVVSDSDKTLMASLALEHGQALVQGLVEDPSELPIGERTKMFGERANIRAPPRGRTSGAWLE
ncbi:hypothetical protein VTN00DRAFT_3630 [Thermoascus crustaceus]|uniref:uncharacterized protein n=1 Tax=Thermoascus crustaceus TaxID=5088 RepID=UPI00374419A1